MEVQLPIIEQRENSVVHKHGHYTQRRDFWSKLCSVIFWLLISEAAILLAISLLGVPWISLSVYQQDRQIIQVHLSLYEAQYCTYKEIPKGFCDFMPINKFFQEYPYQCEFKAIRTLLIVALSVLSIFLSVGFMIGLLKIMACYRKKLAEDLLRVSRGLFGKKFVGLVFLSIGCLWIGALTMWFTTKCSHDVTQALSLAITGSLEFDSSLSQGFAFSFAGLVSLIFVSPCITCIALSDGDEKHGVTPLRESLVQITQTPVVIEGIRTQ